MIEYMNRGCKNETKSRENDTVSFFDIICYHFNISIDLDAVIFLQG